ncbi:unnamed protein product [Prorocentrum cordatum]|nr:unnamed protein product [Polarella glacialis]
MAFGDCVSVVVDNVMESCGHELIPTECSGTWDCFTQAASSALDFFICGFPIILDSVLTMYGANCLPNVVDGIKDALFPPEIIVQTAVVEAIMDFGDAVYDGIYEASLTVASTLDWCWDDAPSAEFTDCDAFEMVASIVS